MHATTWMKFENGLMEEDRKGHILYYCTYVKYPEYANPYTQKVDQCLPEGCGSGAWRMTTNGYRVLLQGEENFLELHSGDDCASL